jgi:hypothetical protein
VRDELAIHESWRPEPLLARVYSAILRGLSYCVAPLLRLEFIAQCELHDSRLRKQAGIRSEIVWRLG